METKWALITGASSGFGIDYAHLLAKRGYSLILTARRESELEKLSDEVRLEYQIKTKVIPADLSRLEEVDRLVRTIDEAGLEVETLINNAGFGLFGDFVDSNWQKNKQMLDLDVVSLTYLTHVYANKMRAAKRGGHILLIASIGAYQPTPTYAAYSAAKSYVLSFGEALNFELKKYGIKVSVLSPGITATEFLKVSGQKPTLYQRFAMMQSRPVAEYGLKQMFKGVASSVPGLLNKLTLVFTKLIPRRWQARLAYSLMKN